MNEAPRRPARSEEIVMKYEDARRLRGVESAWLRLGLWFSTRTLRNAPPRGDLNLLTERERRDIGLPEPVRYMDWHSICDKARF